MSPIKIGCPLLRWIVVPSVGCLDSVYLPVDDPAWDIIYPLWLGCRCTVIQVCKGSRLYSDNLMAIKQMEEMTKGREEIFRFNPGKEKCLFPKKHPYYGKEGSKERKDIESNISQISQSKTSLTAEQKAHRKELQREAIKKYQGGKVHNEIDIQITRKGIKEYLNQPHAQYFEKNELVKELPDLIKNSTYIGRFEPKRKDANNAAVHIFEVLINEEKSYLIVNENNLGECTFHSISDNFDISNAKRLQ